VRFYAGVPVRGPSGRAVGTICVWDRRPRQLHADEIQLLRDVAALAERELREPA
jgi:GAF domain-containing protein